MDAAVVIILDVPPISLTTPGYMLLLLLLFSMMIPCTKHGVCWLLGMQCSAVFNSRLWNCYPVHVCFVAVRLHLPLHLHTEYTYSSMFHTTVYVFNIEYAVEDEAEVRR